MMRLSRYGGNPNIGVFAVANESLAFVASDAPADFVKKIEEALGVKTVLTTMAGSYVVGSLVVMNSNGSIVSGLADGREVSIISEHIPCMPLDDQLNAAGNNILANDNGALVSDLYEAPVIEAISDILGVECVPARIAGCSTVGSVCKATNKGCICHPDASDEEVDLLKSILKVDVLRTSVNHGSRAVGAGVVANSKGAVVGDDTTPIEMGKIEDGLGLY